MTAAPHHPPHIYLDNTWYVISAATRGRLKLLHSAQAKTLVRDQLRAFTEKFGLSLAAWVILDNHYHVLIKSQQGARLPHFFRQLHGRISFDLNQRDGTRGRQVWHNYWNTCIRTEADYWLRFNYIHHNPVKHGYVANMRDWLFSSYGFYLHTKGEEWLSDALRQYPVIDFTDASDAF